MSPEAPCLLPLLPPINIKEISRATDKGPAAVVAASRRGGQQKEEEEKKKRPASGQPIG